MERDRFPSSGRVSFHFTLFFQINKLYGPRGRAEIQISYRDRQIESPRSGAARIYVQNCISLATRSFVGMAAYHDMKLRGFWIQVKGLGIVQYINIGAVRFDDGRFRERFSPVRSIDISAHGYHRSDLREGFQYGWIAYITGMNDQV